MRRSLSALGEPCVTCRLVLATLALVETGVAKLSAITALLVLLPAAIGVGFLGTGRGTGRVLVTSDFTVFLAGATILSVFFFLTGTAGTVSSSSLACWIASVCNSLLRFRPFAVVANAPPKEFEEPRAGKEALPSVN